MSRRGFIETGIAASSGEDSTLTPDAGGPSSPDHEGIRYYLLSEPRDRSPDQWRDLARDVEALGFDGLYVPDHLSGGFSALHAIRAVAPLLTRASVGTFVLNLSLRAPDLLAAEIARLRRLTARTIDVGVGAGWLRSDWTAHGQVMPGVRERVDLFGERVARLKRELEDSALLVGAGGPRMLTIAAEVADAVAINPRLASGALDASALHDMSLERVREKVRLIGARNRHIQKCIYFHVVRQTSRTQRFVDSLSKIVGLAPDDVRRSPYVLVGSKQEMIEKVWMNIDLGITRFVFPERSMNLISETIVPAIISSSSGTAFHAMQAAD